MSDPKFPVGGIPLHDNRIIGLIPEQGRIGLHPLGKYGWIVGIIAMIDMRHYREEGSSTDFLKLELAELSIPGIAGNYTGKVKNWEYEKQVQYSHYYKPVTCNLTPGHTGFTTFAWMDAQGEEDPLYWFGWARRIDHLPPFGYRRWDNVFYMGVNYPVSVSRPGWAEVPPVEELVDLMKPGYPSGSWQLSASMSGFTVDDDVSQDSYRKFSVLEGRSLYYMGVLDFVKSSDRLVGEKDTDWEGINWGSITNPGTLEMLSGDATGVKFRVIDEFYTSNDPPPGCPENTWILRFHSDDPTPATAGVKVGDEYMLTQPFDTHAFSLVEHVEYMDPGTYPPEQFNFAFSPI